MNSIQEKAKTAEEIKLQIEEMIKRNRSEHGAYSFEEIQEIAKRKWVRLSDHQQEIDKKVKEIDSWIDAYNKINDAYQKERDLQKQKLRSPELLEKLSTLEHDQWSVFIQHCFQVGLTNREQWEKWNKLSQMTYAELDEKKKDSDRRFARLVLGVLEELLK